MTTNPKKHSRSDDDEEDSLHDYSGKRVKLDSLLKNLSLKDQENEKRYIINPKITYENIFSKSGSRYSSFTESQLASNLNEKLTRSFKNVLESGLRLIPWYNSKFLIMYRYQNGLSNCSTGLSRNIMKETEYRSARFTLSQI